MPFRLTQVGILYFSSCILPVFKGPCVLHHVSMIPNSFLFSYWQNMIDGLGITGYEDVFLKVCEITLSVLRAHKETLMSVLETFIHDPLVEWTKSHKSSGVEVQNPHAQV